MKKLKCSLILLILNLIINNVLSMHKTLEFDSIKLEKYNKLSKQELDKKLLNILNKSNLDKNYLRKCVNLIIAGANINMQKLENINLKELKKSPAVMEFGKNQYSDQIKKCLRLWPQDNNTEGFFVAKITKI